VQKIFKLYENHTESLLYLSLGTVLSGPGLAACAVLVRSLAQVDASVLKKIV